MGKATGKNLSNYITASDIGPGDGLAGETRSDTGLDDERSFPDLTEAGDHSRASHSRITSLSGGHEPTGPEELGLCSLDSERKRSVKSFVVGYGQAWPWGLPHRV